MIAVVCNAMQLSVLRRKSCSHLAGRHWKSMQRDGETRDSRNDRKRVQMPEAVGPCTWQTAKREKEKKRTGDVPPGPD